MSFSLDALVLTGHHVRLEPLLPAHAPALLAAADPSRATFGHTQVPEDPARMAAYIETAQAEHARRESLPFVVLDHAGTVVGSTRFMKLEWWTWPNGRPAPGPEPVPGGPDALEIGHTWYAERVQGSPLNVEAKLLLCAHAFERWQVRRVRWKTDARNTRSRTAILRLGAQLDGVLRAARPAWDGLIRDDAHYSMLRAEWAAAKRGLEARVRAKAAARPYPAPTCST